MLWRRAIFLLVTVAIGIFLGAKFTTWQIIADADASPIDYGILPQAQDIQHETKASVVFRIQRSTRAAGITEQAVRIAKCESKFDAYAVNPNSNASGVYQWLESTWEWIESPGDRLNAQDNIDAFVEWYPRYPGWWECK